EKPAEKESEQPKESEEAAAPAEEEKPKPKPHVAESEVPLNLIVVADTDMLSNAFWVQAREFFGRRFTVPVANNGDFVLNAVENLSGTSDLIGLRSRGTARRPFTKVEEMTKAAQEQFQAEEQRLMRQLKETEKKLIALQGGPAGAPQGDAATQTQLTPEQEAEVEKFTEEMLATRKALRQVRHNLKKDIEGLRNRLSFLNIALVPILVTIAAGGLGAARMRRRRRAVGVTE
ncbi:MAG: ABC transporter, partial [Pseudomonadota bacterium]|nr:ABC transporter [Pseudomonadota bacterium]